MPTAFFRLKIYRQKFLMTVTLVFLASAVLFSGLCFFLLSAWLDEQREAAADFFADIDLRVHNERAMTDESILRLYSNTQLMEDLVSLFLAQSEAEYLASRTERSLSQPAQIRSAPDYLRGIIASNTSRATGATLLSRQGVKAVWFDWISGQIIVKYDMESESEAQTLPGFGDTVLEEYSIHDPDSIGRRIGEIQFWLSGSAITGIARAEAGVCAAVGGPEAQILGAADFSEQRRGWILRAAKDSGTEKEGSFSEGIFNRVFYFCSDSELSGTRYVSLISLDMLLWDNRTMLLLLVAAFVLLDGVLVLWTLQGYRYDARFLGYILDVVANVENGNFAGAKQLEPPGSARKNEYGIIARAVRNMSRVLEEFIRIEYRLKLKQQETAMRVLQHQINPHFLYNTLETIRSHALVVGDMQTADSIALLGGLYRDVVRGDSTITLRDEFDLLEVYLQIMHLRFPESFSYLFELEPELHELKTVKFWMQPLAENFFTHGFDRASEYNLIIATGAREEGGCRIEIIDNGSGIPPEKLATLNTEMRAKEDTSGGSIGLRNVYERLAYFYGEGFTMEIRNNSENGTCISIHIPEKEDAKCTPC